MSQPSSPQSKSCLDSAQLGSYLNEQLDEQHELEIQEHIGQCSKCQQSLEQIAGEQAMWDGLKHLGNLETKPPADVRLANLVEFLTPSEDPQFIGRLGCYDVCGIIGQGSTGLVLKALETRLNRFVAIKVLAPNLASNGAARKRFEREGRAIAAVSHEHVVPIYAVDEFRGLPYIVMQYIPGLSLLQRMDKSGALNTCEVVRIGLQVARGLAAAHGQGIIHRDVKPANVILEQSVDRVMVTDFGLAQVADEATMTRSGTISGTPQYMSPEQARGESLDPRTDLFSLGSLMYAASTARAPFRAETVFGIIHRVCETEPRPIRELNTEIAPWLADFIGKLMAKRPADRFASAEIVANLLESELAHLQNPTVIAEPQRDWRKLDQLPAQHVSKPAKKSAFPQTITFALAGCLALIALAAAWANRDSWLGGGQEPPVHSSAASSGGKPNGHRFAGAALVFGDVDPQEDPVVTWSTDEQDNDSVTRIFRQRTEQSFTVSEGDKIVLDVNAGNVEVRQTELDYVSLVVLRSIEAGSQAEAERIADNHNLSVNEDNGLEITAALDPDFAARGGERMLGRVVFGLGIPAGMDVDLTTQSGNIEVNPISASLRLNSRSGDITCEQVDGDVWARSVGGEIVLTQGVSGGVDLMATHGNVCAAGIGGQARLRASNGNIYVGPSTGNVSAHATGGDVRIAKIAGRVGAHVAVGNVYVSMADEPAANASLSVTGGDIFASIGASVPLQLKMKGNVVSAMEAVDGTAEAGEGGSDFADAGGAEVEESEDWQVTELNGGGTALELVALTGAIHLSVAEEPEDGNGYDNRDGGGNRYFSLGGSGNEQARREASAQALEKTSGEPRPGAMVPIEIEDGGNIDGYTLYLPVSYDAESDERYPIILYLQGGYGVGGPVASLSDWGLPRLIRDENDLDSERNRLLLDTFVVVSIHIQDGNYYDQPEVVEGILDRVIDEFHGDRRRVYVTGLSRGGHGSWGMCSRLPQMFAAAVPIGGRDQRSVDYSVFESIPVWIAHNQGDSTISFDQARSAADKVTRQAGVEFAEFDEPLPAAEELESNDYVFTHPDVNRHDAWTELYCSEEFYRWLLRHSR